MRTVVNEEVSDSRMIERLLFLAGETLPEPFHYKIINKRFSCKQIYARIIRFYFSYQDIEIWSTKYRGDRG